MGSKQRIDNYANGDKDIWPGDADGIDLSGVMTEVRDGVPTTRPLTPEEVTSVERSVAIEADQADRDADAVALRDDFQAMKDLRDAAATSRTEMDAPDGEGSLSRWNPVKEAADEAFPDPTVDVDAWRSEIEARIDDQAKLLNLVTSEIRRVYGDIRSTAATLVRKFRKDRDDE